MERIELDRQQIEIDIDPVSAFAKLRSYTPGRGAFLLEALDPAARFSVVGYRTRRGESLPPGVDAAAAQASEYEPLEPAASLAEGLAEAAVGFIGGALGSMYLGVPLCRDEGPSGTFNVGATVMLYDHREGTVTVAGPRRGNTVERCIWELSHGPDVAELPDLDGAARPEGARSELPDEQLLARARRAMPFVDELESLVLTQTFAVPLGDIDAFGVYRALCELSRRRHGYFVDFGHVPTQSHVQLLGVSDVLVHQRRRDEGDGRGLADAARANLARGDLIGGPLPDAARVVRRVEESSRQIWGGAVGYLCPGGEARFVSADELVVIDQGALWCTGRGKLVPGCDPEDLAEQVQQDLGARLAAIAAATR